MSRTIFNIGYGWDIAQIRATNSAWTEWPWTDSGRLTFDRFDPATWFDLYYQAAILAQINGLAPVLRGAQDVGFQQCLPMLRNCAETFNFPTGWQMPPPTFMPFVDTAALGDVISTPTKRIPFDFGNDAHLEQIWTGLLRPFFEIFDDSSDRLRLERTPNNSPLITWWGLGLGVISQGMYNWLSAQRLLDYVSLRMTQDGYDEPDHIVDTSWPPSIRAYGMHNWFDPPGTWWTAHTYNNVTTGVAVPGFHDHAGSAMTRLVSRRNGAALREALAGMRAAKADHVFLESLTNIEESAGFFRSDNFTPNSLYLDVVREHVVLTRPDLPPSEPTEDDPMMAATLVISRKDKIPHTVKPGYFVARHPTGSTVTVLSVQPDGTIQTRPMGTQGGYEEFREEGNKAVFPDVAGVTFAIPLVD